MTTSTNGWAPPGDGGLSSRAALVAGVALVALILVIAIAGYVLLGFLAPKYPVALAITPSVSGRTLTIDGRTDLPDRTIISYEVWHGLRDRQLFPDKYAPTPSAESDQGTTPQILAGSMAVSDGRFEGVVGLTDWPAGEVFVTAYFEPDPEQPADVRARFGDHNEHLGGPNVVEDSDGVRSAVAKATVSLP
jgi:hypothetical protein